MLRSRNIMAGVDLGGTSMKVLIVDGRNKILASTKARTERSSKPGAVTADIVSAVEDTISQAGLKRRDVTAVSVGAPGSIDRHRGVVHDAPNLGWDEYPLGRELEKRLRIPVLVDNDVNVGTIGEHALGAGAGASNLMGIFVGTGIGGGIIANGRLYEGSHGGAGEIGHTVILVDGPVCGCGHRGCVEALASRTAMERDVRAAIKAGRKSVVLAIMKKRGKDRMTSSVIQAALKERDKLMQEVVERAQHYLGILVANMVNLLDPECVVVGGGIASRLGEHFVGPIRETAHEFFLRPRDVKRVKILGGRLGDNAGALGAVVLARQRLG